MHCPHCDSTEVRKNGKRGSKQNHICTRCGRQFIDTYDPPKGYSEAVKQQCLKLYLRGLGFRAIEEVTGVHHTTVIYWVKRLGQQLPDAPEIDEIPEVTELDELETYVKKKQNLDLDSGEPFQTRDFSVGHRRS
jgi:transposase-like protein